MEILKAFILAMLVFGGTITAAVLIGLILYRTALAVSKKMIAAVRRTNKKEFIKHENYYLTKEAKEILYNSPVPLKVTKVNLNKESETGKLVKSYSVNEIAAIEKELVDIDNKGLSIQSQEAVRLKQEQYLKKIESKIEYNKDEVVKVSKIDQTTMDFVKEFRQELQQSELTNQQTDSESIPEQNDYFSSEIPEPNDYFGPEVYENTSIDEIYMMTNQFPQEQGNSELDMELLYVNMQLEELSAKQKTENEIASLLIKKEQIQNEINKQGG